MVQKQRECVCGFSGTEGKVLSHIMNKRRWQPDEDHKLKKDGNYNKTR